MNFASDNAFGVSERIMQALQEANRGAVSSYGADNLSRKVEQALSDLFEKEVAVFQVVTGTAANALSIAAYTPPYGAVLCHRESHIMTDECGAPEFFSAGAKLVGVAGEGGKVTPQAVEETLSEFIPGFQHHVQPAMLSLTQATEAGTVYTVDEITALADLAHRHKMSVHMDGARFANAVAGLNVSPADLTWRAGVDVLSFGATKNGAMAAEAVILFDSDRHDEVLYRRKRAGHLISKSRFVAAQLLAYLADGHWLHMARHANGLARRLADGLTGSGVARLAWPVEANEVFPILPRALHVRLKAAGAIYHEWPGGGPDRPQAVKEDEVMVRLVTSFATPDADVDAFLRVASAG